MNILNRQFLPAKYDFDFVNFSSKQYMYTLIFLLNNYIIPLSLIYKIVFFLLFSFLVFFFFCIIENYSFFFSFKFTKYHTYDADDYFVYGGRAKAN